MVVFETDNISSVELLLGHNNILSRYLPASLYLPGTTLLLRASAKGATSTIFIAFGMALGRDPQPTTPEADALTTELPGRFCFCYIDSTIPQLPKSKISSP